MYSSENIIWIKNVKHNKGIGWAYEDATCDKPFLLNWSTTKRGSASTPNVGDIIVQKEYSFINAYQPLFLFTLPNQIIKGKFYIPMHIPAFILKLLLGKRSVEILKSTTVSCKKIKETGFVFLCSSIEAALHELTAKK